MYEVLEQVGPEIKVYSERGMGDDKYPIPIIHHIFTSLHFTDPNAIEQENTIKCTTKEQATRHSIQRQDKTNPPSSHRMCPHTSTGK